MKKTSHPVPRFLVIGLFGLALAPAPAHAADIFTTCCNQLVQLLQQIDTDLNNFHADNHQGQLDQLNSARENADYLGRVYSDVTKQQSKVDAKADYPDPTGHACAVATLSQSDSARDVASHVAIFKLDAALGTLFTNRDSGNSNYQARILKAACNMAAVGPDRHGDKMCNVPVDANLKDRDILLARAITGDPCIPLDPDKVAVELQRIATTDSYTPSDPVLREATLAMLLIHRYLRTDQPAYPFNNDANTQNGMLRVTQMTDSVARRQSSNQALLNALDYHACYSKAFLPDCTKGDAQARQYLALVATPSNFLPDSNYCLSQWQMDLAKNIEDRETLKDYHPGGKGLADIANNTLLSNIHEREKHRDDIDNAAALAITEKNADYTASQTGRAPAIADAAHPDMVDAMKRLTRALERIAPAMETPRSVSAPAPAAPPARQDVLLPLPSSYSISQ